jgi:hypothetical protein
MNKKQKLPNFVTHYYDPTGKPFLNLSELSDTECAKVISKLNELYRRGLRKAFYDDWYMPTRRRIEREMREEFLKKGGVAPRRFPHYFWWGGDNYREQMCKPEFKKITLNLSQLPRESISFTYPDSIGSMVYTNDPKWSKHYHGKVFTYEEIHELFLEEEFPSGGFERNAAYRVNKYVEVQLWCDDPIQEYITDISM